MKVYQTNEIKNIALIGSAGSGKTTLFLRQSFCSHLYQYDKLTIQIVTSNPLVLKILRP